MNPSELQFRPARAEDGVLIARLRHKIWQTTYRGIYPDEMLESFDIAWHTQKDIQRILSPDYAVFLIVCGERPVGYLNLRRGETPHLLSLYVQKEYQNLGIGGKAFAFVREYFRDEGAAFFTCDCQPDNRNAMDFYRHQGGTIIREDLHNEESWQNSVTFQFFVQDKQV